MKYQTPHDIMRERLLQDVTATSFWNAADTVPLDMKAMDALQWGKEWKNILQLMKNRMTVGGYRYEPTKLRKPKQFDHVADVHRRLKLFTASGNMEHLLDAANITILACLEKDHPNFHFESIDDGEHAQKVR